jgi:hypothetical protein
LPLLVARLAYYPVLNVEAICYAETSCSFLSTRSYNPQNTSLLVAVQGPGFGPPLLHTYTHTTDMIVLLTYYEFWCIKVCVVFNVPLRTKKYCHAFMAPWSIITGFGLDDWIYWRLLVQSLLITLNYNRSQ